MNKTLLLLTALFGIIFMLSNAFLKQTPKSNIHPLEKKWEKNVPLQAMPKGLTSMSAAHCGNCHPAHYQEWQTSTHAHAWTDLQFQAEIKKKSSPFMCINCHIPLQNQQEYMVKGLTDGDIYRPVLEKNKFFDKELQQEGITCAACHIRNHTIVSVNENPNAPHAVYKDPDFLSEQLCISCHNANAVISDQLSCSFETGDEWGNGPYHEKKNCISCHMETTHRANAHGFPIKKSHFHQFPGSGIPKVDTIISPIFNGLTFQTSPMQKKYHPGDSIQFNLKVKNEKAGHKVPTGDPERFFLFTFELKNKNDSIISSQVERVGEEWQWYPKVKKINENNFLPSEQRTYHFHPKIQKKGKYTLTLSITKHRMNKEAAEYNHLGSNYPLFVDIFHEKHEFMVQ